MLTLIDIRYSHLTWFRSRCGSVQVMFVTPTLNCVHTKRKRKFSLMFAIYYRPQRSWAKVIFSQASVCPQGGCLPHFTHPRRSRHPPASRPPPREEDFSIRSTSGMYACNWNAFLFFDLFRLLFGLFCFFFRLSTGPYSIVIVTLNLLKGDTVRLFISDSSFS